MIARLAAISTGLLAASLCAQTPQSRASDASAETGVEPQSADIGKRAYESGRRLFQAGDYPGAVKQLANAVDRSPKLPGLESLYGRALLNTGDPDSAAEAFQKALAADPSDFGADLGLGQVLLARRSLVHALPLLQRALALRPDSAEAKLRLAECLAGLHRYQEAHHYAEVASQALPASAEAHQILAIVLAGLRRPADADAERELAKALAAPDPGPAPKQSAPDFTLPAVSSGKAIQLSEFRGRTPVVLVFGSYSCPNFRASADALKSMYVRYGSRVQFLLVYIREAHSNADWQSTRNLREGVALAPATTLNDKRDHAAMCSRTLHLPFTAVVDGMDDTVEKTYNAWPSRAFVIGIDGRIQYRTRLTELEFHSEEMESVLGQLVTHRAGSRARE
jgi:tetratricopeptide (TPR) repeat protein